MMPQLYGLAAVPVEPYYVLEIAGKGLGVFANRGYSHDHFILEFRGKVTHFSKIHDFTHYIQIAPGMFLGPGGKADDYVNHGCEPNSAVYMENSNLVLRAFREIQRDEEIVFDYGTILFDEPTTFHCDCGSKKCRGIINNYYTMPLEQQVFYQTRNMVPMLCKGAPTELSQMQSGVISMA